MALQLLCGIFNGLKVLGLENFVFANPVAFTFPIVANFWKDFPFGSNCTMPTAFFSDSG